MSDDPTVWLNDSLTPASEARLSPFDHGLLVGDGVFETVAAFDGIPFAWTRHYRRLVHSATNLGFEPPASDVLLDACGAVLAANGLTTTAARLRLTITSGPGPLGSDRGHDGVTALVSAAEQAPFASTTDVVVVPWARNERGAVTGLKTTSYAENARAIAYAKERGAGEAIFANTLGNLCEGTGTNVYVVAGDDVVTPPLSAGCLDGVTRQLILELATRLGIPVREVDSPVRALGEADEAFLSSSTRGAQPIANVDGHALSRAPGATTEKLAVAYAELVRTTPDP